MWIDRLYPPYQSYGIADILKEYSGYPSWLPLPVGVQHGWMSIAHSFENSPALEYWAWSEHAKIILEEAFPRMNIRMVGCPFLYLLKLLNYTPSVPKAGSIVFPCHSTDGIRVDFDVFQYARELRQLPPEFHPIKVCIHHKDMGRPEWTQAFGEAGFEICTNGPSTKQFLYRFVENARTCRFALSNQVTSGLLFGIAMGLTSALHGPEFRLDVSKTNELHDKDYNQNMRQWEESVRRILRLDNPSREEQLQLMSDILGVPHVMPPREMRKVLYSLAVSPLSSISAIRQVFARLKAVVLRA